MHSTNNILYFWFQTCYKLQPILDTSHPSSNKGYDCKFENNKDQFVAIVFIAHVSLVTSDQHKQTVNAFTSSKLYYLHKEARFDEANWLLNEWPHPDFFSCLVSVATRTETDGASSPYHLFIITQEREGANKTQNVMFGFMPSQAKQGVQGNQMSKCVLSSPATDLNMGQLTCARPISVLLNVSRTQKRAQKKKSRRVKRRAGLPYLVHNHRDFGPKPMRSGPGRLSFGPLRVVNKPRLPSVIPYVSTSQPQTRNPSLELYLRPQLVR